MGLLRDSVVANFVAFSAPLEGCFPYMYIDVKGLVTVAIGNLIDPLTEETLSLPFVHTKTGAPATRDEIRAAWQLVKSRQDLRNVGAWNVRVQSLTDLRLMPVGIEQLVGKVRDRFASALAQHYPGFADWPADAQLATMAMAWACGPAFHIFAGLKPLEAALKAGDFKRAMSCCHLDEHGNAGLHPRNEAMRDLFFLAAARADDPETLHWPAVDHIKAWQREHMGEKEADGVIGPKTLAALGS